MKKMKKLLSMLLAATMTLAMAAPSFAEVDKTKNGVITIKNATVDKEYTAYRIFEATRGNEETKDENAVAPISYIATADQQKWFKEQEGNIFNFTSRADTEHPYYVTVAEGVNATRISEFLTGLITSTKTVDGKEVTEIDTTKEFFNHIVDSKSATATSAICPIEGLGYGYFLVTSGLGTTISLDSTNPAATILDKNQQGPSKADGDGKVAVTLDSDGNIVEDSETKFTTANYGDKVSFKVQFSTTNYVGENPITEYKVTDTLGAGMTYDLSQMKVMVNGTQLVNTAENTVYTVSPVTTNSDGLSTFSVAVDWTKGYDSPAKLVVIYSATVNQGAAITNEGIKNTAKLTYTVNGEEQKPENLKDEVTTYLYALAIQKTDRNGAPLQGATFTLDLVDKDGKVIDENIKVSGSEGNYEYDARTTTEKATITSPEKGTIIIKGLKAGRYRLTETKAPNGYNLLDAPQYVNATLQTTYKTTYYYTYTNGVATLVDTKVDGAIEVNGNGTPLVDPVTVINNAGQMLPATGGIGTTIFYAIGIILMAGAVFFVVRRKKA